MQRKISVPVWLAVALVVCGPARAADIDQAGAEKLKSSLTHYLPKDLAESGFLTVRPGAGRYEIAVDLMRLIGDKLPAELKIKGLEPFAMSATPAETDRWKVDGTGKFDVTADYKTGETPGTMRYATDHYDYSGILDPAISYFRNATFTATGIRFASEQGPEKVEASFDSMNYVMSSADATGGTLDFTATGAATGFRETVVTKEAPPFELSADSIAFDATIKGMMLREVNDLVVFVLDHLKEKQLSAEQQAALKDKVLKALPLAASIDETVRLSNLSVGTPLGPFGFKGVDYGINMTGLSEAARFGISVKAHDPKAPDGVVPAAYMPLMPADTEISFSFQNMNLGGFLKEFIEKADFTKDVPMSDEESAALAKTIFPDGRVTMNFDRVAARSDVYDLEMSGVLHSSIEDTRQVSMTATLLARNFDRTITFVQDAAKADPELNQLSFGMMMAKGFAKSEADGTQRWDVAVNEDGSVEVNGQQVKGPNAEDEASPDDSDDDQDMMDGEDAVEEPDALQNSAPEAQE